MKQLIIGTAGHVDHGKTALIRALTGTDTDRLAEERRRGITIEVGFAQLRLPDGRTAGVVDVPGHERFIGNMLVGAAGMDVCLLLVAADEGVMPQTREHLAILSLLGVQRGILVLTKADLVDDEWLEAIAEETREHMAGTFLEDAPLLAVSSVTGRGLPELLACITTLVDGAEERRTDRPFRLPVDRVFSVDGFGAVVTGTLLEGRLSVGDEVEVCPKGRRARVRGLQNHDTAVQTISAGMRTAVNLSGIRQSELSRGDVLAPPGGLSISEKLDVQLVLLNDAPYAVKNDSRLHLHHGTREVLCKCVLLGREALQPGETGFAQLRLTEPLCVKNGDRFVVRFFSPTVTVGGGVVLNNDPVWRRRSDPKVVESLAARASGKGAAVVLEALRALEKTMPSRAKLAAAAGLSEAELAEPLAALIESGAAVELGGKYLTGETVAALRARAGELLAAYHSANPLQPGMNRSELRGKLGCGEALIDHLAAQHGLRLTGPAAALPEFEVVWNEAQAALRGELEALYRGFGLSPESNADAEAHFPRREALYRQVAAYLLTDGALVPIAADHRVHREHYERALQTLDTLFAQSPELTLPQLRDALGVSRKYALLLLEHWDTTGVTTKRGDVRTKRKETM